MKLNHEDILQSGDTLCQKYSQILVGTEWFGKTVGYFISKLPSPELVTSVERGMTDADKIGALRNALESHIEWLENVDHDYSNGNSACGCDEGSVLGQRGESQLIKNSRVTLEETK